MRAEYILILPICWIVLASIFLTIKERLEKNRQTKHRNMEELYEKYKDISDPPWTLSGYFERMIRESEKLAKDRKAKKYEPIILWLTLNGLQINEDGSYEWIEKENPYLKSARELEEKEKQKDEIVYKLRKSYYISGAKVDPYWGSPFHSNAIIYADNNPFYICQADKESLLQMQLNQLQSQYATLQTQLMSQAQTEALLNTMTRWNK